MKWYLLELDDVGNVKRIYAGPYDTQGEAEDQLNNLFKLINNKLTNVVPGQIHIALSNTNTGLKYIPTRLTDWQWNEVVKEGMLFGKLSAVKLYKDLTRAPLMDCKRAVEHYFETYGFKFR